MALSNKDQRIATLSSQIQLHEQQGREYLSFLTHCVNGESVLVQFNPKNSVRVQCQIESEWMDGNYYKGEAGRKSVKPLAPYRTVYTKRNHK